MILQDSHLKIDETPIRAGRTKATKGPKAGLGKMKTGYLWPVLGEKGDIVFGYSEGRSSAAARAFLGESFKGTIQTDGYRVYADYAARLPQCVHALCWSHTRRAILKAEQSEPQLTAQALEMIRALYAVERRLKEAASDERIILGVFLTDAWLALDTNDLERALRVIPMGKKNAQSVFM
ncbi:MAG: transposase [Burkholderiaceae bacterium]